MGKPVTLVTVRQPDMGTQLWVAAVSPRYAILAVSRHIPDDWVAEIAEHQLTDSEREALKIRIGEVGELGLIRALARRR